MSEATKWSDLSTRIISAVSLLLMAVGAALFGRLGFGIFTALVCACMAWELARMYKPKHGFVPLLAGAVAFLVTLGLGFAIVRFGLVPSMIFALLLVVALSLFVGRAHPVFAAYLAAVLISGQVIVFLFQGALVHWLALLILTVIATDVAGYLAGRSFGGPKFWPRVSPKKTWSGIVAGWIAAGLCGAVLAAYVGNPGLMIGLAIVMSFASQMGDIAESAMKRKAGVKDSSDLIPGHGGFLDRFDGVVGASLVMFMCLIWVGFQ